MTSVAALVAECLARADHFLVALVGSRVVGHVWYTISPSAPQLGLIGHVLTHSDYRRRGISRQLMDRAIAEFDEQGGKVMQLFTSTPYSLPFYEQLGFETLFTQQVYHERDWYMRSPRGSAEIVRHWLVPAQLALRPLAPGDLPQYCLLYNLEHDQILKDRAQQIGFGLESELAFIDIMNSQSERRAAVTVLENGPVMLGAASLVRSQFPHQAHVALFDIYLPPAVIDYTQALAQHCLDQRSALNVEHVYALAVDQAKRELFPQLGFQSRGLLAKHYRIAQQRLDCELFELVGS